MNATISDRYERFIFAYVTSADFRSAPISQQMSFFASADPVSRSAFSDWYASNRDALCVLADLILNNAVAHVRKAFRLTGAALGEECFELHVRQIILSSEVPFAPMYGTLVDQCFDRFVSTDWAVGKVRQALNFDMAIIEATRRSGIGPTTRRLIAVVGDRILDAEQAVALDLEPSTTCEIFVGKKELSRVKRMTLNLAELRSVVQSERGA